jgi:hypothetical protein
MNSFLTSLTSCCTMSLDANLKFAYFHFRVTALNGKSSVSLNLINNGKIRLFALITMSPTVSSTSSMASLIPSWVSNSINRVIAASDLSTSFLFVVLAGLLDGAVAFCPEAAHENAQRHRQLLALY